MKNAQMVAVFFVTMVIAIFSTAQTAYAQPKTIDTSIYDRCKLNPFLLSVGTFEGDCIIGKQLPQELKRQRLSPLNLLTIPTLTPIPPLSTTPALIQPSPTSTPTPTLQPATTVPTPDQASSPAMYPPANAQDNVSLNADKLFSMVNAVRVQNGLSAFEKDTNTCSIAESRAPQLYNEIMVNHDMHAGFYALHLPYWATENIIYERTEAGALNWWMNEPIHRAAILGNFKYSCIACQGEACSEIFTNYLRK